MLKASQVSQLALVFENAKDDAMWPLAFIDGNEPPFLLRQGGQDFLVQPIHSQAAESIINAKDAAHVFENHDHMTIIGASSKIRKQRRRCKAHPGNDQSDPVKARTVYICNSSITS